MCSSDLCEAEIVKDDIKKTGLETQRKIQSLLLRMQPHPQEAMTVEDKAYMRALGDTMRRYGNE